MDEYDHTCLEHEASIREEQAKKDRVVHLGKVGADSGMLLISDPCYNAKGSTESYTWTEFLNQVGSNNVKSLNYKMGHEGRGVVLGTGDGTFTVEGILNDDDKITEIRIKL